MRLTRSSASGEPARRGLAVAAALAVLVAVAVGAYFIGRGSRSPAQVAAQAQAPPPSLLTVSLRRTRPHAHVVFRATLQDEHPEAVAYPEAPSGVAVASTVDVHRGGTVSAGSLLGTVSGQPVFVFPGAVPAYGPLVPGSHGVNVSELQQGLRAIGYSTGGDHDGVYGAGTAAAVTRLYQHYGLTPVTREVSTATPAEQTPGSDAAAPTNSAPSQSPAAAGSRQSHLSARDRSVSEPKPLHEAVVPFGEVSFVPTLPATVAKIAGLGQTLQTGKPFAELSSGELILSTKTNTNTARLLRAGLTGRAVSDISGTSVAVRVVSVGAPQPSSNPLSGPLQKITMRPLNSAKAEPLVGQNLAVHLTTGAHRPVWVVPVSALVTTAAGKSSVTVLVNGRQHTVRVRAGALLSGAQVIYPHGAVLHQGEQVVVGLGTR